MKKILFLAMVLLLAIGGAATAAQYVITDYTLTGSGWTHSATGGYNGAGFDYAAHADGTRRAYWYLPEDMPFGYYTLEAFIPSTHAVAWIPYEVDSAAGMDSQIPWIGAFGTNHQYGGIDQNTSYGWTTWGAGPHLPDSQAMDAGASGNGAWMGKDATHDLRTIYLKFDYGWDLAQVGVSAIRVTQVTPVPEPSSLLALLAGLPALAIFRKRS